MGSSKQSFSNIIPSDSPRCEFCVLHKLADIQKLYELQKGKQKEQTCITCIRGQIKTSTSSYCSWLNCGSSQSSPLLCYMIKWLLLFRPDFQCLCSSSGISDQVQQNCFCSLPETLTQWIGHPTAFMLESISNFRTETQENKP